ncbi:MAG: class D sortase [Ruminococcus sp.]|nr:class D sortase [Ruminococcus sp.]
MSDRNSVKHNSSSRHHKQSGSNKVLRALTYVLTPFLVFVIVCGTFVLALYAPYSKAHPYLNTIFNRNSVKTQGDSQVSLYHPDDVELQIGEVVIDEGDPEDDGEKTEETHTIIYPYYGDRYGTFTCENAGMIDLPIVAGTRYEVLNYGIGWYNGSVFIGKPGNVVLAGHNNTYFALLFQVKIGDIVEIETDYCKLTYIVTDTVIFNYKDLTYIQPTDGVDRLTCYTCWTNRRLGVSIERYAILCDLVSREWKEVEAAQ